MTLNIIYQDISKLVPRKNNPRIHSKKKIHKLTRSIENFRFNEPILVDKDNTIIAGHARLEAAKQLGMTSIPTIVINHLNKDQIKAHVLATNKLGLESEWDMEVLKSELQDLLSSESGIDIELTGFDIGEIDTIIYETRQLENDPADVVIEPETDKPPMTMPGDLWQLGDHRLFCGDSTSEDSYKALLRDKRASVTFTDPPYNVAINGHVCGKGTIKHREFAMAIGEMTPQEFIRFLEKFLKIVSKYSNQAAITYCCMDWRHIHEMCQAGQIAGYELKNLCVWVKDNGGMGSLYRSRHELVFVFKNGAGTHINNVELGKFGRNRTNVWEYPGVNSLRKGRMEDLAMHPTVKPVQMVADAIMDCSKRRDIVLDPFGGSGTTLIAAEKTGRQARLIEIDPRYCDVTIRRWEQLTGKKATRGTL